MRTLLQITVMMLVVSAVACSSKHSPRAKASAPPQNVDTQLNGFWNLESTEDSTAPHVLHIQIKPNGERQVDYCNPEAEEKGSGTYKVTSTPVPNKAADQTLTINYKNPVASSKSKDASSKDSTPDQTSFSGKITKLEAGVLELDGKTRYVRFQPAANANLSDSSQLCK